MTRLLDWASLSPWPARKRIAALALQCVVFRVPRWPSRAAPRSSYTLPVARAAPRDRPLSAQPVGNPLTPAPHHVGNCAIPSLAGLIRVVPRPKTRGCPVALRSGFARLGFSQKFYFNFFLSFFSSSFQLVGENFSDIHSSHGSESSESSRVCWLVFRIEANPRSWTGCSTARRIK